MTSPDGALAPALDRLYDNTAKLIDPVKEWAGDRMLLAPSLYQQLLDDVPAKRGDWMARSGHATPAPPFYTDAVDLQRDIDNTVKRWCRAGEHTPDRLRRIAGARWRPQDVDRLEHISTELQRWCASIHSLLNPEHVKHVSAPCPACGTKTVYRRNKANEVVRQAALQIVAAAGCTCMACGARWTPDMYLHLCRVLGLDVPAGVLA